jgi:enterobactin synthetase component D
MPLPSDPLLTPIGALLFGAGADWPAALRACMQPAPHSLPPRAAHAGLALAAVEPWLKGIERDALPPSLRGMVARRLQAFVAGRLCAEHALAQLGLPGQGVSRGALGQPLWPRGAIGSIAHTPTMAYAAACAVQEAAGLGLDSEPRVDEDGLTVIRQLCCTAGENAILFGGPDDRLTATIVFSAKESLYKAIHRQVDRVVDFTEVEAIAIDRAAGTVDLRPVPATALSQSLPPQRAQLRIIAGTVHTSLCFGIGA